MDSVVHMPQGPADIAASRENDFSHAIKIY